jgi:hypothetical protein
MTAKLLNYIILTLIVTPVNSGLQFSELYNTE